MSEELSGNALVQACAEKLMGWDTSGGEHNGIYPCLFYQAARGNAYLYRELHSSGVVWNPLASMDDAWEIVRAMQSRGYMFGVEELYERYWPENGRYEATFWLPEYVGVCDHGATEGEAICRAALKALECANH